MPRPLHALGLHLHALLLHAALLLVPAIAAPAAAAPGPRSFGATVTHVTDGDTVWVRPLQGGRPIALRLEGIDAPELCQNWGPQSRQALQRRLARQRVTVLAGADDDYGRTLGRLQWRGEDVGAWMVEQGHAWSYRWRRSPGAYDALQSRARQAGRGLWSLPRPLEPRVFRRRFGSCVPVGTRPSVPARAAAPAR
jgi:endonuclease YncB( thermonuclease family)